MSISTAQGVSPCATSQFDPRVRILKEHFFSLRAAPLEEWLWDQDIPPSAERVFWLHWREGQRRGDFCSEIPLSVVARRCRLNVSSVTRAYQTLERLGCLKRTNPGRNPANPFNQATSITEVFVPKALLITLTHHPKRSRPASALPLAPRAAATAPVHETVAGTSGAPCSRTPPEVPTTHIPSAAETAPEEAPKLPIRTDPFAGLSGRQRMSALAQLRALMSNAETQRYDAAIRESRPMMSFDAETQVPAPERLQILELLAYMASRAPATPSANSSTPKRLPPRALRLRQAAALRNNLVQLRGTATATELLRQITWSVEHGALAKYPVPKAIAIGLRKVREGVWTRPYRMPPNWWPTAHTSSRAAVHNK